MLSHYGPQARLGELNYFLDFSSAIGINRTGTGIGLAIGGVTTARLRRAPAT